MSILVYVDHFQGQAKPASWEIMGKARELAGRLGVPVVALVVGQNVGNLAAEAIACGADRVLIADAPGFVQFNAQAFAAALKAAIAVAVPRIVLAPATSGARDVLALVACELNIGLAAECEAVDLDASGNLIADRPVFSGNIITTVLFNSPVQAATVRARSYPLPARDAARSGETVPLAVSLDGLAGAETVVSFDVTETGELAVENASIIVSGGRGVKGPEGFAPVRDLAKVLGAAVGASRRPWTLAGSPIRTRLARRAKQCDPTCTSLAASPVPFSTWRA